MFFILLRMKKIIIVGIILSCLITIVQPQDRFSESGRSLKRVENNILILDSGYNLDSKKELEIRFFDKFNGLVEYFCDNTSNSGAFGFRINKSNTNYILEVKYISNFKELQQKVSKKYPTIGISGTVSQDSLKKVIAHNSAMFKKGREELSENFQIETLTFPIGNQFVEILHQKMVWCIDSYKIKGVPLVMRGVSDVVFRAVVDDEVWTLRILNPKDDYLLKMSNLCRQIINDAKAGELDESEYMTVLKTFEE